MPSPWKPLLLLAPTLLLAHPTTSSDLTVLHYHHKPGSLHAGSAQPINLCPSDLAFLGSHCKPSNSPHSYSILCGERDPANPPSLHHINATQASCGDDEICVDLLAYLALPSAYCVADTAFTEVPQRNGEFAVRLKPGTTELIQVAQAQLVGRFTSAALRANSLSLTTLRREKVADTVVDRVLDVKKCRDCFDVRMAPLTKDAQWLRAKVVAPDLVGKVGGASLVLATL